MEEGDMMRPRWRITDLLVLTFVASLIVTSYQMYWFKGQGWSGYPNYRIALTIYLAVLATTTIAGIWGRLAIRRFCAGYATFGWMFLCFVLRGGFYNLTHTEDFFVRNIGLGVIVAIICGILAHWLLKEPTAEK
jgi:hypothetical protein